MHHFFIEMEKLTTVETQWKETVKKKKLPFKLWLFNSVPWKDMKITPGLRTESNVNKTEGM